MSAPPLQKFVRSAWTLLLFQLIAAFAAVGVTAWAAFRVRPLFEQRQTLTKEVAALSEEKKALEAQRQQLMATNEDLAQRLTRDRQEARVRAGVYIRNAINAYHRGNRTNRKEDYADAIASYDKALTLDPDNAYTLDLKSYSQFKAGDLTGAIASISTALSTDPGYVYGYSELARYACAAGKYDLAVETFNRAKADNPGVVNLFASLLRDDHEFGRLCAPVRQRFD